MTIRCLELPSELDLLMDMAMESFQYPENPEWSIQADEKETISSQLSVVRRLWPALRVVMVLYPSFRDQLLGYVWEEDGGPAGIVMYQPNAVLGGSTWIVSTVAVLPSYRRRGIGRRLVEAALADMRERGVSAVRLEVLAGNTPAYELYRSLGFEKYASGKALERASAELEPLARPPPPAGYRLVEQGRWDWKPRFEVASRVTPARVRAFRPLKKSDYYPPLPLRVLESVMSRLGGMTTLRFAAFREGEAAGSEEEHGLVAAVGGAVVRRKPGGVNQMSVRIDPAHPEIAGFLVGLLASEIDERSPGRRTILPVPDWQPAVLDAATGAGFEATREWHSLGMILD